MKLFFYLLFFTINFTFKAMEISTEPKSNQIFLFDKLLNGNSFRDIRPLVYDYLNPQEFIIAFYKKTITNHYKQARFNESYDGNFWIEQADNDYFLLSHKNSEKIVISNYIYKNYTIFSFDWNPSKNIIALLAKNKEDNWMVFFLRCIT